MNRKLIIALTLVAGLAASTTAQAAGTCPQPRKTQAAPANFASKAIPASADAAAGKTLYQKTSKPMACKMCHGEAGDGNGKLGKALKPNPRNFTCTDTMKDVSPGQMFWIIKNGSKGTGMVAHGKSLSDKDIWNVVKYIRSDFMHEK
ncbi:MAG: c-type cytochrome [Nitrospina sp.]|nr:c-type cytochrome [Nitrospina sp.]